MNQICVETTQHFLECALKMKLHGPFDTFIVLFFFSVTAILLSLHVIEKKKDKIIFFHLNN